MLLRPISVQNLVLGNSVEFYVSRKPQLEYGTKLCRNPVGCLVQKVHANLVLNIYNLVVIRTVNNYMYKKKS